ncbi:helix-turn-helix transcriptional regulator [Escherichia coli]
MSEQARAVPGQPVLDPAKVQEDGHGREGIHEDWRHAVHTYQPCEGMFINCINGRTGSKWAFAAEGPPAFSVNILLEGRMQAALDDGGVLDVRAGSAVLMATGQYASGWDVLDGQSEGAFRMLSIHIPQAYVADLLKLDMDELRRRVRTANGGEQSHIDAFLGVMPASSSLQRVAGDLLGFGCTYPGPCVSRDLYLRGKAFETLAYFLQENLAQQQVSELRVPGDRQKLLNARALMEKGYDQKWSAPLLAKAVDLTEKRLQEGFQALWGCSVNSLLIRIRLDAAITMLQRGASVTETAFSCGFANLSHFSRAFRSHAGISPKQCSMGLAPIAIIRQ